MDRLKIIDIIGQKYLTSNIENGEFSYQQEITKKIKGHIRLDIRFCNDDVAVLVETKKQFSDKDKEQLFSYVHLEQKLSNTRKIIAILADTDARDKIKVWKITNDTEKELDDTKLKSFDEYVSYFQQRNLNDKNTVLKNTAELNKILHNNGIKEHLRSQFVGTCLLALKSGLIYKNLPTSQIITGIRDKLGNLLQGDIERATKLTLLDGKILQNQNISKLGDKEFQQLLIYINNNILPYIDEYSSEGQDILSYFFTTFNKYVYREDKNQAFTPNHIAHFMCKVGGVNRNTRILDPTCGSGTFLIQAMSMALNDCQTDNERNKIKKNQIHGIEFNENVFGLATTNMLIHGDGNSNIIQGSCFDLEYKIKEADINLVLMNPPYNASKNQVSKDFAKSWNKSSTTDPSKGMYFVKYIADIVKKGKLLTLLPMSCAITTSRNKTLVSLKEQLLENNTLDAVFSFPTEMFYPGASAVVCCMVFKLGEPHPKDFETFFGYFKNDGFEKRKGIGRVDIHGWNNIEKEWLDLYSHRTTKAGISVTKHVTAKDEWCAETYMKTDYSTLTDDNFIKTMCDYASFLVKNEYFKSYEY